MMNASIRREDAPIRMQLDGQLRGVRPQALPPRCPYGSSRPARDARVPLEDSFNARIQETMLTVSS